MRRALTCRVPRRGNELADFKCEVDSQLEVDRPWEPQVRDSLASRANDCEPMLVSIVMPCYNAEAYVREAIESALAQSYQPVEVIVVDDGSTDGSWSVIESFGSRIVAKRNDRNRGASVARNDGLEIARGEYICFCDVDDVMPPNSVGVRMNHLPCSPRTSSFGYRRVFNDDQGSDVEWRFPPEAIKCLHAHAVESSITTDLPLYRQEDLLNVGGFDETLSCLQDFDLELRLFGAGHTFHYVDECVCYARQHSSTTRIANLPWMARYGSPTATVKRFRYYLASAENLLEAGDFTLFRYTIARWFHMVGRHGLAAREPRLARIYFAEADRLYKSHKLYSKPLSRLFCYCLGPYLYEVFKHNCPLTHSHG